MQGRPMRRLLFLAAFGVVVAIVGIGVAIAVDPVADAPNLGGDRSTTESVEHVAGAESVIQITGEALINEAPEGTVVLSGVWGDGEGEFGIGSGTPREGPCAFAVSPVDGAVVVLDWANSRVQVFDAAGSVSALYELPGTVGGYRDVVFDSANRVVVLRAVPDESCVIAFSPGGGVDASYAIPAAVNAERLSVIGDEIWVWTVDDASYPVVGGAKAYAGEEMAAARRHAFVSQSGDVNVSRQSAEILLATVTRADGTEQRIRFESALPMDSIRVEAAGPKGTTYFALRVYAADWPGTESWCVIGVAADGTRVGQVRWPCRYWAGGEFHVGPDGAAYNMASYEDHVEIIRYELGP